jgi:ArsR family transcriptional regulator
VNHIDAAQKLRALGDPTRLQIYDCLRQCAGDCEIEAEGRTVTQVCCSVADGDRAPSTMSFHLKELRNAGLIRMKRKGRTMVCSIDRDVLGALADYFGGGLACCQTENTNEK